MGYILRAGEVVVEMSREKAKIQLELLQLARRRIDKEIVDLLGQFCKAARPIHLFRKFWLSIDGEKKIFKVGGYVCILCRVQKPLEIRGIRCPICNELLDPGYVSSEDVSACTYCGFNNLSGSNGIPLRDVPKGDELYF